MSISSSPSRSMVSIVLTIPRWASWMLDGIAAWPNGSATTVAGARLERHDIAKLGRGDLLRHDRDEWPVAVDGRRDQAVDERDGTRDPAECGQDLRRRVHHGADRRAERRPDAVDRRAQRRTARSPRGGAPQRRVEHSGGAGAPASF